MDQANDGGGSSRAVLRPTVLVNPTAGPGGNAAEELRSLLPGAAIEPTSPDQLARRLRALLAAGADVVGVCGGDGTVRAAAGILADSGVALCPFPGGTRNHFCRAVGLHTLADAAAAFAEGATTTVDLGEVNGAVFVNNSSLGFYPATVRAREEQDERLPKRFAHLLAAVGELVRRRRRLRCRVDAGPWYRAWLVFVGNGAYGDDLMRASERASMAEGVLDARLVLAEGRVPRLRAFLDLVLGRIDASPVVVREQRARFDLELRQAAVDVALDGEVVRLRSPLRYRVRERALPVRVPAGSGATVAG